MIKFKVYKTLHVNRDIWKFFCAEFEKIKFNFENRVFVIKV